MSDSEYVITVLKNALDEVLENIDQDSILAVGIAMSGLVLNNELLFSTNLKWSSFEIKREIEEHINKLVIIENFAVMNGLSVVDFQKSDRNDNVIYIEMEYGIGSVHIQNGDINTSIIGEIGHTTSAPGGEKCFCGNYGCLEVMCGVDRILSLAAQAGLPENITIDGVLEAVKTSPEAKKLLMNAVNILVLPPRTSLIFLIRKKSS